MRAFAVVAVKYRVLIMKDFDGACSWMGGLLFYYRKVEKVSNQVFRSVGSSIPS